MTLGALPLPLSPPKGPVWRWIALSLASVIVTHAIFFGEDRYHIVITPMLCILAAAALRRSEVSLVSEPSGDTFACPSAGTEGGSSSVHVPDVRFHAGKAD